MIWILGELKVALVSPLALKLTFSLSRTLYVNGNSILPTFDTGLTIA